MGTAVKHPRPDRVKPSLVIFWHASTVTLRAERQSAWMSKVTNDDLNPVRHRMLYPCGNSGRQRVNEWNTVTHVWSCVMRRRRGVQSRRQSVWSAKTASALSPASSTTSPAIDRCCATASSAGRRRHLRRRWHLQQDTSFVVGGGRPLSPASAACGLLWWTLGRLRCGWQWILWWRNGGQSATATSTAVFVVKVGVSVASATAPRLWPGELLTIAMCLFKPFDDHCCHIGTAIKQPVPHQVKPSFVIFDIRALWWSGLSVRVPGCQTLQMTA